MKSERELKSDIAIKLAYQLQLVVALKDMATVLVTTFNHSQIQINEATPAVAAMGRDLVFHLYRLEKQINEEIDACESTEAKRLTVVES